MKKIIYSTLFIILTISSYCQDVPYYGFALSGNTSNLIFNTDYLLSNTNTVENIDVDLRNSLGLHFYWNKNNMISFITDFNYAKTSGRNNLKSNMTFEIDYAYIHWISNRIGFQSSLNIDGIKDDKLKLDLELAIIMRLTNVLDLTYSLAEVNLFTVNNTFYRSTSRSSASTGKNGIPDKILTNLGFRFNIRPRNEGLNTKMYQPSKKRMFGIRFNFGHSKLNQSIFNSNGDRIEKRFSNNLNIGLGYIIKPFDKISYSINLLFNNKKTTSDTITFVSYSDYKSIEISPLIRRNIMYADGFGLYLQGGPIIGFEKRLNNDSYTLGFIFEAGFTYIIKDRFIIDGALSNISFRRTKSDNQKTRTLQFDPFSLAKISGTVLF